MIQLNSLLQVLGNSKDAFMIQLLWWGSISSIPVAIESTAVSLTSIA